jgi:hypothetical protein
MSATETQGVYSNKWFSSAKLVVADIMKVRRFEAMSYVYQIRR